MIQIHREFFVDIPSVVAWRHLVSVRGWPSWAKHIRRVELSPSGVLTSQSTGVFYLKNHVRSEFKMAEYHPPHSWKWIGRFLWLSVSYDHRFEPVTTDRTKLIWTVEVDGIGASTFGRAFALLYCRNLDQAIPALVAEMNSLRD